MHKKMVKENSLGAKVDNFYFQIQLSTRKCKKRIRVTGTLKKLQRNIKSPAVTKLCRQSVCACELPEYSGNSLLHHLIKIAVTLPHSLLSVSYKYMVLIATAVVSTICFFQFQTAFIHIIMASFLICLGRFAFFGLIITQCIFLSAYLKKYDGESNWYLTIIFFGPAVIVWILRLIFKVQYFCCLSLIWGLYIVALVVNIAMVFGKVGDKIDKNEFLGPKVLKMILCITPLLLLLFINTGDLDDSEENEEEREIVSKLRFPVAVDLFDGIEMINIVLEEREHDFGIPKAFSTAMIVFACLSMLVSPWHMAEKKVTKDGAKIRFRTALCRNIVQIAFVNLPFLVTRAVVFIKFGKDESIFIAKNGIAIVRSILEIRNLRRLRRVRQGEKEV